MSNNLSNNNIIQQPKRLQDIFGELDFSSFISSTFDTKRIFQYIKSSNYSVKYFRQDTIAKHLGLSLSKVNRATTELMEYGAIDKWQRKGTSCIYTVNPILTTNRYRDIIHKIFMTLGLFLVPSFQIENHSASQLSSFSSSLSLYINPPISPKGITAGLENKKQNIKDTVLRLGSKYRFHYKDTLRLYAYPIHILKQTEKDMDIDLRSYQIRSNFRYFRKILKNLMTKHNLKPLWKLYYRAKHQFDLKVAQEKIEKEQQRIRLYKEAPKVEHVKAKPYTEADAQNALDSIRDPELKKIMMQYLGVICNGESKQSEYAQASIF